MKRLGLILIIASTIFPAFQLFALPDIKDQVALFSQYLGLAALVLMAWGQILATRMPGLESVFGGLDRIYVLHKWAGIVAMAAILLHDTIDAEMRGLGQETLLTELAETLGEISLYGLLILVVISIATFIPYHLWKWTHKAMGTMFAAGSFHFFFIMKPFAMSDPAGLYTGLFCIVGLVAYAWTLLPESRRPSHAYVVQELVKTGGALAITMAPQVKALKPQPGQFGVLRFAGLGTGELHPFTFSGIGADGTLRVTIKALGDFTTGLERTLKVGQAVNVQGPFGRFRLSANAPEVWIAGGIGITPFLAWAQALAPDGPKIDLFYCVRSRETAPHLEEIEAVAKANPALHLHVMESGKNQRLTAQTIDQNFNGSLSDAKISICGPVSLREMLQTDLKRFGVSSRNFHYEEFEFRTGIGLTKLATWILEQSRRRATQVALKPEP